MRFTRGVLGIGLPKLSMEQGALLQRAKKYAMEVQKQYTQCCDKKFSQFSIFTGVHKVSAYETDDGSPAATNKIPSKTAGGVDHEQVLQAFPLEKTKIISRIYVGCINYDTKEDSIKTAFLPFGPARSITMSWDAMTGKHKVSPQNQFN